MVDSGNIIVDNADFRQKLSNSPVVPLHLWDVSKVTDMSDAFVAWDSFNQDLSGWDVSSVTTMAGMFQGAVEFNQDLSGWDVSSVTTMAGMFQGAVKFNRDLSGWDVSNVTDMSQMFKGATTFNHDISCWRVADNVNILHILEDATAYTFDILVHSITIDDNDDFRQKLADWKEGDSALHLWDVSKVTDMSSAFANWNSFNQNISCWNVSNVTTMARMFQDATNFNQDVSKWNVSNVTDMSRMFQRAANFNQDLSKWNVSQVTSMSNMFDSAVVFNQPLESWSSHVSMVSNMNQMFLNAAAFAQPLLQWTVGPEVATFQMFDGTSTPTTGLGSGKANLPLSVQNTMPFLHTLQTSQMTEFLLEGDSNATFFQKLVGARIVFVSAGKRRQTNQFEDGLNPLDISVTWTGFTDIGNPVTGKGMTVYEIKPGGVLAMVGELDLRDGSIIPVESMYKSEFSLEVTSLQTHEDVPGPFRLYAECFRLKVRNAPTRNIKFLTASTVEDSLGCTEHGFPSMEFLSFPPKLLRTYMNAFSYPISMTVEKTTATINVNLSRLSLSKSAWLGIRKRDSGSTTRTMLRHEWIYSAYVFHQLYKVKEKREPSRAELQEKGTIPFYVAVDDFPPDIYEVLIFDGVESVAVATLPFNSRIYTHSDGLDAYDNIGEKIWCESRPQSNMNTIINVFVDLTDMDYVDHDHVVIKTRSTGKIVAWKSIMKDGQITSVNRLVLVFHTLTEKMSPGLYDISLVWRNRIIETISIYNGLYTSVETGTKQHPYSL